MKPEDYRKFLSQAFIEPLRSVLIVDDDYPTFEEMLIPDDADTVAARASKKKLWRGERDRVRDLLHQFRTAQPPLIVDIHDGVNVGETREAAVAKHLHQSDLLILDFQLDRDRKGDGSKAINIVRTLFKNDHFNLVVLHSSEPALRVFNDLLIGLLQPIAPLLTDEERKGVKARIGIREDDDRGYLKRAQASISADHYVAFREAGQKWPIPRKLDPPSVAAFTQEATAAGFVDVPAQKLLAKYLLELRQTELLSKMSPTALAGLEWCRKGVRWIRTDSGFIAFSRKQERKHLLEELLNALEAWGPPPSRLFLAKLRARLDRVGVSAESNALGNKLVLARWYRDLLSADEEERESRIKDAVDRHADLMLREVLPDVWKFAGNVIDAEKNDPDIDPCLHWFDVDFTNPHQEALVNDEHNAFICSRTPNLRHLETGHVFTAEGRTWICLTPLCDLVPGRREPGSDRFGRMDNVMPFMAVRLQELGASGSKPTTNRFVFLKVGGVVKAYTMGIDEGSNPHWFNLYALNEGRFDAAGFSYRRVELNAEGELEPKKVRATIVAQLQYEYALNLMQRLGFSMTRVGLDFVERVEVEPTSAAGPEGSITPGD